ncbi:hypothetical protein ACQPYK_22995 [Streptosporangium sp. CA-135522]|uniref:hypothetical protein n=1 Tax=Streptosporangium sp. CA-135522 TaxID=3240072 RepID=UPI003D8FFE36
MRGINDEAERAAITEAIERLLNGTPTRSTGALTILQLAAEAGVKRWVLTHKHIDLKDDFQHRAQAASKLPPAFQHLEARIINLEADNKRLRAEKRQLQERNDLYAMVINELSALRRRRTSAADRTDNITELKPRTT